MPRRARTPVPDVVLLAAGRGSRLGGTAPKPLTALAPGGETLVARQLRLLAPLRDAGSAVHVVVGHREQELRDALPGLSFVRAPRYASTNTARSLQVALEALPATGAGVLWLNTDVVFSEGFADTVVAAALEGSSLVGVRRGRTAEEEVKYRLGPDGCVTALSKQVRPAEGEAIGVNLVSAQDRGALLAALRVARDDDYFEAAVEATAAAGTRWRGLDLTEHFAVEVDFPEDLAVARAWLAAQQLAPV